MYISDSCPFCLFSDFRPSGGKLPNCSKTLKMVLSQTWLPRPFKQQETSPKRCTNRVLTSLCSEKRITALPGREVGAGAVPSGWSARPASSKNARNPRKSRVIKLVAPRVITVTPPITTKELYVSGGSHHAKSGQYHANLGVF